MARCRIVKPEFWDDGRMSSISLQARLVYIGMWNFCDDYGVTKANTLWLKSRIFPCDPKITLKVFEGWLKELSGIKRILVFESNGEKFFYLPNFSKHQFINRPSKAKYPDPPDNINDDSLNTHGGLQDEIEIEIEVEREKENKRARAREAEGVESDFSKFWTAYPKKVGKIKAEEAWNKQNGRRPPIEAILSKIEKLKKSRQWQKDGGQYIPHPTTWINQGRWDDEPEVVDECPGFDWSKP